jgi:hypothetical protein
MYAVYAPPGTTSVAVTATVMQPTRVTMRINGVVTASGAPAMVALTGGVAIVTIRVDAESGSMTSYSMVVVDTAVQQAYVKASNTNSFDFFGTSVALSADGSTLAVGAPQEDGVRQASGAVYVFARTGTSWAQQAYLKASNVGAGDSFGTSVTLSADGSTLGIGAPGEDSSATGVNGDQADNIATDSGAVYVFTRTGTTWAQQVYLKASNTWASDFFGTSVALSADGSTLAISAPQEDSGATGVNGNQSDNSAADSGAVYIFTRTGSTWTQQAYVKASNTGARDAIASSISYSANISLALSADGNILAVGAPGEDSDATGVSGNQANDSATDSGAVYVFTRTGTTWAQQAYVKASNTGWSDFFGASVALSANGSTLAVAAPGEYSGATGINGNQSDDGTFRAGAVYLFTFSGATWAQQAYLKASNTNAYDYFGSSVALRADGNTLAVGARGEGSSAAGLNGNQNDNSASDSGAVYMFVRTGITWTQQAYAKASNSGASDDFGHSVALSADGTTLSVGSPGEASRATGINGQQADNSTTESGAVYVFIR